jgi:inorganic pyrophosphatase
LGEGGDSLDILVLLDALVAPGCIVTGQLIGAQAQTQATQISSPPCNHFAPHV